VTPDEPHQLSLIPEAKIDISVDNLGRKIDVVYVTRFQKERWQEKDQSYLKIDEKFLRDRMYSETKVLHPLPRVGELDVSLDSDKRAVYFQQAAYGVPIRMALISALLGIAKHSTLKQFEGGFASADHPLYDRSPSQGLSCGNSNCIVHDASEANYVRSKFHVLGSPHQPHAKLRCHYCEMDEENFVAADERTRKLISGPTYEGLRANLANVIFFPSEADARTQGYGAAPARKRSRKYAACREG
jgi:hypothetical protein